MHTMQSETIYFYSKNPQHYGILPDATMTYTESNRICGDVITVYFHIRENSICDWSFSGDVSMITLACSGLFGDIVQWIDIDTLMSWDQTTVIEQTGIDVSPRRKRAQVLALLATRNAIHTYRGDGQKDDFSDVQTEI